MAAPLAPLTPHASARHFLGAELRHRRLRAGLSMNQLAPLVLASPDLLAKVERAVRFPSEDLVTRCDHELGADGYLIRLHGLVVAERDIVKPPTDIAALAASLQAALGPFTDPHVGGHRAPSVGRSTPDLLEHIDEVLGAQVIHPAVRRGHERGPLRAPISG
ncbi:MAG: helix-turn-helix domain-containing protein [Hamadaea sp.]|nr:helix-turn-helix domain-containing protein [Hamadaea sp.]